jgi:hypothetical protein
MPSSTRGMAQRSLEFRWHFGDEVLTFTFNN